MKSLLVVVILLLFGAVNAILFQPGRKVIEERSGRKTLTITEVCTDASKVGKSYCGSDLTPPCDAKAVYRCSGVGKGLTFDCDGSLPFCNSPSTGAAVCSDDRHPNCQPDASDFECTGKGVFPDPFNCKFYYYCYVDDSGSLVGEQYVCDNGYVFDPSGPKNFFCRYTNNKHCTTSKCSNKVQNLLLSYQFFPKTLGQIVASCRGGGKPPYIFRCEEGFLADLNTLPIDCKMTCKKADKRPYVDDSTKYYECVRNGKVWEAKLKSCFPGYYFDGKLKQCVFNPTTAKPKTTSTTAESTSISPESGATTEVTSSANPGSGSTLETSEPSSVSPKSEVTTEVNSSVSPGSGSTLETSEPSSASPNSEVTTEVNSSVSPGSGSTLETSEPSSASPNSEVTTEVAPSANPGSGSTLDASESTSDNSADSTTTEATTTPTGNTPKTG